MRMRTRIMIPMTMVFLLVVSAFAGEAKKNQEAPPIDEQAMMDLYMKAATPGEPHKRLEPFAGKFQVKGQMWMAPGQPPVDSSGIAEGSLILGGRYLEQRFTGNFMGMTFQGIGYTGYDNVKKEYVGTWIDSMGTGIMTSTGSCDETGKVMTFTASWNDPVMGPTQYDEKITVVDDDHHIMEMWGPAPDGTKFKMMELHYTRVK